MSIRNYAENLVKAVTNPHLDYDLKTGKGYKNAVTGDYDLFAVWPSKADEVLDSRVGGMTATTTNKHIASAEENKIKIGKEGEKTPIGKLVGNISERVFWIAQLLNGAINTEGGKVNRVYHSDEAGRPYLDEVDEAAVFTPDEKIFMVSPDKDTKQAWQLSSLMRTCNNNGYTIQQISGK